MTFLGFIPPLVPGSYDGEWHDCRLDCDRIPMSRKEEVFAVQMLARWGHFGMEEEMEQAFATQFWRFSIP